MTSGVTLRIIHFLIVYVCFSSTCFQADLAGMDLSCLTCSELNKKIQALEGNASETQRELTAAKQSMEVVCAQLEIF